MPGLLARLKSRFCYFRFGDKPTATLWLAVPRGLERIHHNESYGAREKDEFFILI